tara:strand:- start:251 stop:430 length:180 start_codon:yes stop_codon:yes gene_type:complete
MPDSKNDDITIKATRNRVAIIPLSIMEIFICDTVCGFIAFEVSPLKKYPGEVSNLRPTV